MMRTIVIYNQFDVVIVPFPFTDQNNLKRRPALVISCASFNQQVQHAVMLMITSARNAPWSGDVNIEDLQATGLEKPSVIRMKFFTLDNRLILRKSGLLGLQDRQALVKSINQLMNVKVFELE
jgi:mRNA interferase MazF